MKHIFTYIKLALSCILVTHCSLMSQPVFITSQLAYSFEDLHNKNVSEVKKLLEPFVREINEQIQKGDQWSGSNQKELGHLIGRALTIALSKPPYTTDSNRLIQWVYRQSQGRLPLVQILHSITKEACQHIADERRSPLERGTYFYILENIIKEIRPWIVNETLAYQTLEYIRDANIEIPDSIHRERYMKVLESRTTSPSSVAQQILEKNNQVPVDDE